MAAEREITVKIRVTATGLEVFDEAGRKLGTLERSAAQASGGISKLGLAIGTGLVTAGYAAVQALGGILSTIERIDRLASTAKGVGLTVTELSSLRLAADEGGIAIEQVAQNMAFLSRQLVAAQNPTSQQARLFRALGVDIHQGLIETL